MLMPRMPLMSPRRRLSDGAALTLEELDALLDVSVAAFDKAVAKLTVELRKKRILVQVPASLVPDSSSGNAQSRLTWTGVYEAQLQQMQRLERAEEFKMARRYEFLRARAKSALLELGMDEERASSWFASPTIESALKWKPKKGTTQKDAAYLRSALGEFLAARDLYVSLALPLVPGCAQRYRGLGVDYQDLIQEGNASLFSAVEGFDWRRDVRFRTYAQYWIQQAILKSLYDASRTVRVPVWVQKALKKIQRVREAGRLQNGVEPSSAEVGAKLGIPAERVDELLATRRYAQSLDAELPGEDGTTLAAMIADTREQESESEQLGDDGLKARLSEVMADLPERERTILTRRFGLHGKEAETLGDIAVDLGVTAERVRQLQNVALERLQRPAKRDRLKSYT